MSLSVYVHFPWCLQKCPYCDFASAAVQRKDVPQLDYADAVLRELHSRASQLDEDERLHSVFFGGGTPSLWAPAALGKVLKGIRACFRHEAQPLEVTVECNPSSLDRDAAAELAAFGVNRASVGVQSLDPARLRFLGRLHDGPRALQALRDAVAVFPEVSGDLMFGMPGQNAVDFVAETAALLDLGLAHVSIYALTIEPNTQFGALHRKGRLKLAPERAFAQTFSAAEAAMANHGFHHYEVSNYARPGHESRHNLHYWRTGSYLGLGAGAVGCQRRPGAGGRRYRNDPNPARYMGNAGHAPTEVFSETLSAADTVREGLMLGLRTAEGVDLMALTQTAGTDPRTGRGAAIERQRALGNLIDTGTRLRVPQDRWLHLDGIVADLF